MSTLAGFLWKGVDLGLAPTRLMLVDKKVGLIPDAITRTIPASARPGVWDFGTEFGARRIELELVSGDNASVAGTDAALRAIADAFDPTTEAVAGDKAVGQLIFDSEPDKYWLAKLVDGGLPEYLPTAGKMRLTLRCSDPFAYSTALYSVSGGQATISGFTAYRQAPDSLAVPNWNLVKNGGFNAVVGAEWTLHANTSRVVDATSPTGYALRLIATGAYQNTFAIVPVEGGKPYSFAMQGRSDGVAIADLEVEWLNDVGALAGTTVVIQRTNVAYGEMNITNAIAPGSARSARLNLTSPSASGIVYLTALRMKQQTTAPLAWSAADQQVLGNKGLCIYEAATNLLTNGDAEAISGVINGINDPLATLNAWALFSGTAFTVAANVVTRGAADGLMTYGHPDWWDLAAGTQIRWKWVTGGTMKWYPRFVDANNYIVMLVDCTGFVVVKRVAGVNTTVYSTAATLPVNGTQYWFKVTATGTGWVFDWNADAAGAVGANLQTSGAKTVSDSAIQTTLMAVELLGAGMQVGGAFANVVTTVVPNATGWTVGINAGVPAFCVSKVNKFAGTASFSTRGNNTDVSAYWFNNITAASALRTASCRIKTVGVANAGGGNGAFLETTSGGSPVMTGTTDWAPRSIGSTAANHYTALYLQNSSGTAYFDNVGIAVGAYDTLNSGDGQEYSTGARAASDDTAPIPATFDVADFARVMVVRLDHVYNRGGLTRRLWDVYVDGNNRFAAYVESTGAVSVEKVRAGISVVISDAIATAPAAGDTLVMGVRHSAAVGIEIQVSKNGGAITTYTLANPEAKLPIVGTPLNYLGRYGGAGGHELDGTVGVDRILRAGVTAADVAAIMAAPYAAQDETKELAVWRFEGAAVPEDYATGVLALEVGGTYYVDPVIDLTAGGAYTGAITFTDSNGNVLTWTGTVALNDVIRVESDTLRVRKNGTLSMAAVTAGSKWPRFRGGGLRDSVTVGGIASANVKALTATYRHRWL